MSDLEARRVRSPSYPGISLENAIDRAQRLYERENKFEAAVPTVVRHWGYSGLTGPASSTLSAVKQFGLIDDIGRGDARRIKLSSLGLQIVQDRRPESPEREAAIKRAALSPAVYADLWQRFRLEASDHNMAYHLETQGFTPAVAEEVVKGYRESILLAKLRPADTLGESASEDATFEDETPPPDDEGSRHQYRPPRKTGMKTYAIPVDSDHDAVIELPDPMTPQRWEHFMVFLGAMEKVIVRDEEPQLPPSSRSSTEDESADSEEG